MHVHALTAKRNPSRSTKTGTVDAAESRRADSVAAPTSAHNSVFLALHRNSLLPAVRRGVGRLGSDLFLGLLLLPEFTLSISFVLLDVAIGKLDCGCRSAKHLDARLGESRGGNGGRVESSGSPKECGVLNE
jgi:hypothetical protein